MRWFPMTGSSCELGCKLDSQQPGSRNCPKLTQVLEDVGRNLVLPMQLRMLCQWAPQKQILTPQVCSPGSPHLRASVLNAYFPPNICCPTRTGILNFQSGAGLGTSEPLSPPPLGRESCQQVWKRFAVGLPCMAVWKKHSDWWWSPRRAVTEIKTFKELLLILQ